MNDHDAIDAVQEVLEQMYRAQCDPFAALSQIAYIIGLNRIEHNEVKEQK